MLGIGGTTDDVEVDLRKPTMVKRASLLRICCRFKSTLTTNAAPDSEVQFHSVLISVSPRRATNKRKEKDKMAAPACTPTLSRREDFRYHEG